MVTVQVKGKIAEYASSHVTARVIQAVVKYGTAEDRHIIFEELKPNFVDFCKSSYAHFIVCRLIQLAKKDQLAGAPRALAARTQLHPQSDPKAVLHVRALTSSSIPGLSTHCSYASHPA